MKVKSAYDSYVISFLRPVQTTKHAYRKQTAWEYLKGYIKILIQTRSKSRKYAELQYKAV